MSAPISWPAVSQSAASSARIRSGDITTRSSRRVRILARCSGTVIHATGPWRRITSGNPRQRQPVCSGGSWSAGGVGGGQRRRPFRNRRGDHDRGSGVAVGEEPVEDRLQLFDGGGVQFDQETVVAGDPVALGDLRGFGGQLG